MDCQHVREVMFLFIDQEMEEREVGPFQEHVELCPPCARAMGYTRKLLILVRERCVRHAAPTHLRQRILVSFPHRQATEEAR